MGFFGKINIVTAVNKMVDICNRQRITYEPKWSIPLIDLSLDDKIAIEGKKQFPYVLMSLS